MSSGPAPSPRTMPRLLMATAVAAWLQPAGLCCDMSHLKVAGDSRPAPSLLVPYLSCAHSLAPLLLLPPIFHHIRHIHTDVPAPVDSLHPVRRAGVSPCPSESLPPCSPRLCGPLESGGFTCPHFIWSKSFKANSYQLLSPQRRPSVSHSGPLTTRIVVGTSHSSYQAFQPTFGSPGLPL